MRRLLAMVAGLSLLAGCAIDSGRVRPEGRPGGTDQSGVDSPVRVDLARPSGITEPLELVRRFLAAPADDHGVRVKTANSYLAPGSSWLPSNEEVHVVHVGDMSTSSDADGNTTVEVEVQHIGRLVEFGQLAPSDEGFGKLRFTVVKLGAEGVYISSPVEQKMFLSDSALGDYFEPRPLYFWSKDFSRLIPDLRYVTQRQNETGRANLLLEWLYQGPSPWLAPAVNELPKNTQPSKRVTDGQDASLIVDLTTAPGSDTDARRLADQLAKTLLSPRRSTLELSVGGFPQGIHRRVADPSIESIERFGVVNGSARRLGHNPAPVALPEDLNKHLTAVAFSRGEQSAVLVRQDGSVLLWRKNPGGAIPVNLGQAKPSGQPMWLDPAGTALILAGGRLYHIGTDGKATPVADAENLTAVSLAPDKTRIALVQNGRLLMATLVRGPNTLTLSSPRQQVPTRLRHVQNVAFGSQTELFVAGADATNVTLVRTNLVGGQQTDYSNDRFPLDAKVSHMVGWPAASQVMFEVAGLGSFDGQLRGRVPLVPASNPASPDSASTKVFAPSFEG